MSEPQLLPLGEAAFLVRLGTELDRATNLDALALAQQIKSARLNGVRDVVPANSSIGIYFDDFMHAAAAKSRIQALLRLPSGLARHTSALREIHVSYSGPDLHEVADLCGLRVNDVVEIHSSAEYHVFAIGFAPGFAYMGELDPRLSVPRRDQPRTRVPAGSVAIANRQTAIYPFDTPGGWRLIGMTDATIFDLAKSPPCLFSVGDRVRFVPR